MKYSVNLEGVKSASEGQVSTIFTSGIFDIKINNAYIKTTKNGAKKLWLAYNLKNSDKTGILFISLTNNNGSDNFQKILLDKLCIIAGLTEVSITKAPVVTKKGTTEEDCILALNNLEVKVWVKAKYSKYNGAIQESLEVQEFFRTSDNASGKEITLKADIGKRYASSEPTFKVVEYRDGLTEKDIKAWKEAEKAKRMGTTQSSTPEVDVDDEIPF